MGSNPVGRPCWLAAHQNSGALVRGTLGLAKVTQDALRALAVMALRFVTDCQPDQSP